MSVIYYWTGQNKNKTVINFQVPPPHLVITKSAVQVIAAVDVVEGFIFGYIIIYKI